MSACPIGVLCCACILACIGIMISMLSYNDLCLWYCSFCDAGRRSRGDDSVDITSEFDVLEQKIKDLVAYMNVHPVICPTRNAIHMNDSSRQHCLIC